MPLVRSAALNLPAFTPDRARHQDGDTRHVCLPFRAKIARDKEPTWRCIIGPYKNRCIVREKLSAAWKSRFYCHRSGSSTLQVTVCWWQQLWIVDFSRLHAHRFLFSFFIYFFSKFYFYGLRKCASPPFRKRKIHFVLELFLKPLNARWRDLRPTPRLEWKTIHRERSSLFSFFFFYCCWFKG